MSDSNSLASSEHVIAIVGMYLRVPGSDGLSSFWENLKNGTESITFFTDDELIRAKVPKQQIAHPDYVKASGRLADIDMFDADFFDMTPREAEILDPQHRILLEGAWRSLEHAGIDPQRYPGRIGLYAGVGFNRYLLNNIITNQKVIEQSGAWQLSISNDKDFAPTRVAYKLNLQGPAIAINTACSTSLVATAVAASSLLNHQCDTAIAGGCSLNLPQDEGYIHTPGGTLSSDGHCRPFDKDGNGTIDGNGTACVVMKRYEDALADGDHIYAIIKGFGINNDGSIKVGYTAPGVDGQADVIMEALEMAQITPDDIDFIETHGTATELGDTVEIAALKQVFSTGKSSNRPCYLGAVKSNIGHLDTAAGAAGLIKTVLSIYNKTIPPTCNFVEANPLLDLDTSPFKVNNKAIHWDATPGKPRTAGVSSFGIGGTNAHVIVQEPPDIAHLVSDFTNSESDNYLLPVSAKSVAALAMYLSELAEFIHKTPTASIRDIAFTLQQGRTGFQFRTVIPGTESNRSTLISNLAELGSRIQHLDGRSSHIHEEILRINKEIAGDFNDPNQHLRIEKWITGKDIDWSLSDKPARKVAIPGHPFIKSKYWLDPPIGLNEKHSDSGLSNSDDSRADISKLADFKDWFYLPSWSTQLPNLIQSQLQGSWLVFNDGSVHAHQFIHELIKKHSDIVCVDFNLFSDTFTGEKSDVIPGPRVLGIKDSPDDHDWINFFKSNKDIVPSKIVITGFQPPVNPDNPTQEYLDLFDRTIRLCYGLQRSFFSEEIEIIVIGDQLIDFHISDNKKPFSGISKSVVQGPFKVLPQECPNFSTKCIDTTDSFHGKTLLAAITSVPSGTMTALRDGVLHNQIFRRVQVPDKMSIECRIRHKGTYLITGGLGDIGLTLAGYLCKEFNATVYVTGRTPFPEPTTWNSETKYDSKTQRRIHQLKKLAEHGHKIRIIKSDASSLTEMKSVMETILSENGRIDGIIHAAGIVGDASFNTIAESVSEAGIRKNHDQFLPKTKGIEVLAELLVDKDFDFCMICSSLSPILGGLGFAAYASTNAYADSVATRLNRFQPGKWMTVNWEGWMFDHDTIPGGNAGASATELGITASEGIQVFDQLVHLSPLSRIVISSGNLPGRIEKWIHKESEIAKTSTSEIKHPRPDYIGSYTPPATPTEIKLTELWEQLLGIQGIGIYDSFFELGGNSLLLTQLVSLIRKHFKSELTLSKLFEQPTIFEMASDIDQVQLSNDTEDFEEGVI